MDRDQNFFEDCVMTNFLRNGMIDNLTCLAFNLLTEVQDVLLSMYILFF